MVFKGVWISDNPFLNNTTIAPNNYVYEIDIFRKKCSIYNLKAMSGGRSFLYCIAFMWVFRLELVDLSL